MRKIIVSAKICFALAVIFQAAYYGASTNSTITTTTNEKSYSTSIIGMEILLELERELLKIMESYANKLERKLTVIRGYVICPTKFLAGIELNEMTTENLKSQANPEKYLSNPLNSYALIRRLHEDWVSWMQFLKNPVGEDEINSIERLRDDLPTSIDIQEAADGIYRITAIYDVSAADMAKGLINGVQYDVRLTAIDCYSIGYQMMQKDFYKRAENWLNISLQLHRESDSYGVLGFSRGKILELYAQILLHNNKTIDAVDAIDNALHLSPNKSRLLDKKSEIELKIKMSTEVLGKTVELPLNGSKELAGNEVTSSNKNQSETDWTEDFRKHCNQYANESKFYCVFNKTTSPFLQLAPLKMEILNMDPYVVLYHDVISDAEIAELKELSKSHLRRAKTMNLQTLVTKVDSHRTVKTYFASKESKLEIIKRLRQRIADMSGFDLWDSEIIEFKSYGIGGHYLTHYDFFNRTFQSFSEVKGLWAGDRISTVLFYMSDVEQGGATAFPEINLGVYPKKGTALMWHNLNGRLEADARTQHAACPVIVGSKWVFTLWIREYSQMFRKPCYDNS